MIHCHPCPEGFIPSAFEQVRAGLAVAGAEVRVHDLYREGFVPELTADEHRRHLEPGVEDDVQQHADDLRWCDTLVLVYPTWWSGQPAMLKGWIDRVWASGVAWDLPDGATRLRPRLRNIRRLVAVTSHGSSKLVNSVQGEGGKRTMTRSLRSMCHPRSRTDWIALYGIDTASDERRRKFLDGLADRIAHITRPSCASVPRTNAHR
ncbi:MAG: NAD(P)H-dependent oxidoreductase [Ilumatobacter sp.]